jgi:hypothetical protein
MTYLHSTGALLDEHTSARLQFLASDGKITDSETGDRVSAGSWQREHSLVSSYVVCG